MNRTLALFICLFACSPAASVAQTPTPAPGVERASDERPSEPVAPWTIAPGTLPPDVRPSPVVTGSVAPRETSGVMIAPVEFDDATNATEPVDAEGEGDVTGTPGAPPATGKIEKSDEASESVAGFGLDDASQEPLSLIRDDSFRWRPAINQSLLFLGVQHGYAFTQPKTRRAIRGKFFKDYAESVKSLHGWADGGRFFTNYVAHTMQGSFTGFIYVQNSPRATRAKFGRSPDYWKSRLKAMAWTAAWSTQFEIGPISQASIGNVGLSGKQTYVDLVVTPTIGTGLLITEDALDRYVIERLERRFDNFFIRSTSRVLLNPTRTVANLIRFKTPWYRDRPRAN